MTGFEGSFLGDSGRIDPATIMECGVCWWVYDPALGDDVWQIAADTAFADLPSHWRCPICDAAQAQFMVLDASRRGTAGPSERPAAAAALDDLEARRSAIEHAYRRVDPNMRPLPVYNDKLDVQVTRMRRCEHGYVCVAATPWCMNLIVLPSSGEARPEGTSRELAFPSGSYTFTRGRLEGVGAIETCSLFSPMEAFDDPATVAAVAEHAMADLFKDQAQASRPEDQEASTMSRRRFLRRGSSA